MKLSSFNLAGKEVGVFFRRYAKGDYQLFDWQKEAEATMAAPKKVKANDRHEAALKLLAQPLNLSISLESPQMVLVLPDLILDPSEAVEDFVEYFQKHLGSNLIVSSDSGIITVLHLQTQINWPLESHEVTEANNQWTLTIKVPLS